MADYGAIVSQKGYDVETCADRFLVFSSAFQTLKVFATYSVSTTIPASGTNTITITHNLGYYAPFVIIYNGSTTIGTGNSYFFCDSDGAYYIDDWRMYVDRLEIDVDEFFDITNSNAGDTVYFTVYIFLDDFRTVAEQNINTGTTSGSTSSDYGFRVSKAGYDVKTCADVNCVLSSSFFNQIVHKKGITTDNIISHSLGYIPNFLVYSRDTANSFIGYSSDWLSASSTEIDVTDAYSIRYYIIFKDKLV